MIRAANTWFGRNLKRCADLILDDPCSDLCVLVNMSEGDAAALSTNAGYQAVERRNHSIAVFGNVGHLGSQIRSGNSRQLRRQQHVVVPMDLNQWRQRRDRLLGEFGRFGQGNYNACLKLVEQVRLDIDKERN